MTREEALDLLGLKLDATDDQIDKAYRQASKHLHPNAAGGGDRERWEALLHARDIARARSNGDLVPVSLVRELVREQERALEKRDRRQERAAETKRASQAVVRRHTSRLDERKRSAWAVGVGMAAITLLTSLLKAIVFTGSNFEQDAFVTALISTCGVASIGLGLIGLTAQTRAQRLEHEIEDVTNQLSQKAEWLSLFREIRRHGEVEEPPWSPEEFAEAISEWADAVGPVDHRSLASTASTVGSRDFGRLMIAKGLELELLAEETEESEGEPRVSYNLLLRSAEG
ncbi:MAG TPA: J domain-containing protein [Solirubrobacterales bacterium]|nr:J domain-containing protein [Solirubrobacterales bacterium]